MKIEINLDETRVKDLVDNELKNFTDAELHDILSKAISQYVIESNTIEKLFYNKKKDYYGNETGEIEPTFRLEEIVKKLDINEMLEKLKNNVQEVLDNDETIKILAENIFYRVISGRISEMIWSSNTLRDLVTMHAGLMIDERLQKH